MEFKLISYLFNPLRIYSLYFIITQLYISLVYLINLYINIFIIMGFYINKQILTPTSDFYMHSEILIQMDFYSPKRIKAIQTQTLLKTKSTIQTFI